MNFLMKFTPLSHQRREILDILHCMIGPTSAKSGCLACGIYEGAGDDPTVLYLEQWEGGDAIQQHIRSPLFLRILAVMDMSMNQPEIHFYETTEASGLAFVEKCRGV